MKFVVSPRTATMTGASPRGVDAAVTVGRRENEKWRERNERAAVSVQLEHDLARRRMQSMRSKISHSST
jgi:hypothetical protein